MKIELEELKQNVENLLQRGIRHDAEIQKLTKGAADKAQLICQLKDDISRQHQTIEEMEALYLNAIDEASKAQEYAKQIKELIKPTKWGTNYTNRLDELEQKLEELQRQHEEWKLQVEPSKRLFTIE